MNKLVELIPSFITGLIAEKNMSLNTVNSYKNDLLVFSKFLLSRGLSPLIVDRSSINSFIELEKEKGFSENTVSRRLSTLRQFYKFLVIEGKIGESPCKGIKNFKTKTLLPRLLSQEDVSKLLSSSGRVGKNKIEKSRNKALLEILYGSGLRVSELVSLRKSLFYGNPKLILIKGKGRKERIVPISVKSKHSIRKYLKLIDESKNAIYRSDFLFPSRSKSGFLNRERFFLIIKEIALHAGLDTNKISPHKIRHAFASHLLENGADLRVIQTLLGHKNLTTTEIYTHILDKSIKETVQKKHPFGKKRLINNRLDTK